MLQKAAETTWAGINRRAWRRTAGPAAVAAIVAAVMGIAGCVGSDDEVQQQPDRQPVDTAPPPTQDAPPPQLDAPPAQLDGETDTPGDDQPAEKKSAAQIPLELFSGAGKGMLDATGGIGKGMLESGAALADATTGVLNTELLKLPFGDIGELIVELKQLTAQLRQTLEEEDPAKLATLRDETILMLENLNKVLTKVEAQLSDERVAQIFSLIDDGSATLADARALVANLNQQLGPLLEESRSLLGRVDETLATTGGLLQKADGTIVKADGLLDKSSDLLTKADPLLADTRSLIERTEALVANTETLVQTTIPLLQKSNDALDKLTPVTDGLPEMIAQVNATLELTRTLMYVLFAAIGGLAIFLLFVLLLVIKMLRQPRTA